MSRVTSNITSDNITNTGARGRKGEYSDSGVVDSDTDTMSCCDDDSSPDHYQPIGLHGCKGVADKNKTVDKSITSQDAETRAFDINSNNFPPLSDTGIINDDDPELDKIFASVEVCVV